MTVINSQFLSPKRLYRGITHEAIFEYIFIARPQLGETPEVIRDPGFWAEVSGLFVNGPNNIDVIAAQAEFPPFRLVIEGELSPLHPGLATLTITEGEGEPEWQGEGQTMPLAKP